MSDIKDMPPAGGEVEVLGHVSFVGKDFVRVTLDGPTPTLNTQVVNRVYATQLEADLQAMQSERDALKADVERKQKTIEGMNQMHVESVEYFQSELTKARELLTDLKYWAPSKGQVLIETFLAHQSAPAAKGD